MNGTRAVNGFHATGLNGTNHAVKPTEEPIAKPADDQVASRKMLELVIENLSASVQSALSYLQGPLKQPLHDLLHDQEKLPDAKLSRLAGDAVDVLFKAQQMLEPKSLILADHFLGKSLIPSFQFCRALYLQQLIRTTTTALVERRRHPPGGFVRI